MHLRTWRRLLQKERLLDRGLIVAGEDELHALDVEGRPVGGDAEPGLGVRDRLDTDDDLHGAAPASRILVGARAR